MTTRRKAGTGGFTLVELMVAVVLGGMLTLGIVILYLTAQRTWLEASSQLMLQQEATLTLGAMLNPIRGSHSYFITPDSTSLSLEKCDPGLVNPRFYTRLYWDAGDSLVHVVRGTERPGDPLLDLTGPPVSQVKVERLRFGPVPNQPNVLRITVLRARDVHGQTVELQGLAVLQNYWS